jgi:hypothetical protein
LVLKLGNSCECLKFEAKVDPFHIHDLLGGEKGAEIFAL